MTALIGAAFTIVVAVAVVVELLLVSLVVIVAVAVIVPVDDGATKTNVPVALAEAIENKVVVKNDLVILVDVGSGLAYGGALIRL